MIPGTLEVKVKNFCKKKLLIPIFLALCRFVWNLRQGQIWDWRRFIGNRNCQTWVAAMVFSPFRGGGTTLTTKACRLKALIRHALFDCFCRATASRPSPSGGLRPALTQLPGETKSINSSRRHLSSSTRNDEGPYFFGLAVEF